jgi:bacillithiol synthase
MSAGRSRVISEPLGGSALSLAVQQRKLPAGLQPWSPTTLEEWREHVEMVRSSTNDSWYDAIQPAIAPTGAAAKRLERVVAQRGVVVTTGQQAALFGGPLYTLAKALTALGLADALEQQLGVPAAPVFWGATDDADFLEARATYVADADGLHKLGIEDTPPAGTPMSLVPPGDMGPLLEQLRRSCGSAAYAEYFEIARSAFTEMPTLGDAYIHELRELLGGLGIAVLDSSHPGYRETARPTLLEALTRAKEIGQATAERAQALRVLGFEPQVEDERGLSLVAIVENGIKRRIPIDEALKVAERRGAEWLAPNVLLRPVVERAILPTVAYVGGPAELAYFAQSDAVATALGKRKPVGVPRWSCSIIEPFADKALKRLGVDFREVRDLAALERRLATDAIPPNVASSWKRLQEQVHASVRAFGSAVQAESLMPAEVVEGLDRSLSHKLGRAERRLLAAVKRRDERVRRDLQTVGAALFPMGQRQERVLNFVPMLTRGGPDLLEDMQSAAGAHGESLVRAELAQPAVTRRRDDDRSSAARRPGSASAAPGRGSGTRRRGDFSLAPAGARPRIAQGALPGRQRNDRRRRVQRRVSHSEPVADALRGGSAFRVLHPGLCEHARAW